MLIDETLVITILDRIPVILLMLMVILMVIPTIIIIEYLLILRTPLKNLSILKRLLILLIEEKLSNVDALTRTVDRLVHQVDMLKIKILPPNKDEMPESLKAIQVSINYNTKMIAMLRARREREEREAELRYLANKDEDIKTIGMSTY